MPTYDYRCSSCGERIEIVHSIHGGPPETCPNCGAKDTLRKEFAPPAIVFKGTGWAKKERAAASRSSASKSADGGSGSGGDDGGAKPASSGGTSGGDSSADGASGSAGSKKSAEPAGT